MYKEHLHCLSCTSQFKNLHLHEKKKKSYENVAGALGVPIEFDKRRINSSSTNNITRINPKKIDRKPNPWYQDTNTGEINQIESTHEISKACRYNNISHVDPSQTTCREIHKRAGMIIITDIQNLKRIKVAFKFKSTEFDIKKRYSKNRIFQKNGHLKKFGLDRMGNFQLNHVNDRAYLLLQYYFH